MEGLIDPVCGMTVAEPAKISCDHLGTRYGFCCEHCRERFLADPAKYLKPQAEPAEKPDGAGTVYFCPMCPGVESDRRSACPKCGMMLEPKLSSGSIRAALAARTEERCEYRLLVCKFILSLVLTVGMIGGMLFLKEANMPGWRIFTGFAAATILLAWPGRFLLVRGIVSIRTLHFNMFTLILLGIGASYLASIADLILAPWLPESMRDGGWPRVYFQEAAMIATLILFGQVLEARARAKTSEALNALLDLAPPVASRIRPDGSLETVELDEVRPGDLLRIRAGEKIPVDGTVTGGLGAVDKSLMTGESMPESCGRGSAVIAGTLNTSGSFDIRAEKLGDETMLARMIALVAEAQASRPPARRLVDTVSAVFVPVVLLCSIGAFGVWTWGYGNLEMGFSSGIAVLLIACPCALGLAAPMSIVVAIGIAAKHGILVRDAGTLEAIRHVRNVILDKTGTVTEGRPRLMEILTDSKQSEREHLLAIAAAVERHSSHPLAKAVAEAAEERHLAIPEAVGFAAVPGMGVSARVDGAEVLIGSGEWMKVHQVDMTSLPSGMERVLSAGETVFFVAESGCLLGAPVVSDPVRPETLPAVEALQKRGIRLTLLSGDDPKTAAAAGRQLGITDVVGGVLPEKKYEIVRARQREGITAMVGDGINDAAALAAADVGIAMGGGADAAMKSAGMTLLGRDLGGLVRAMDLGTALGRNTRQNLFFAFIYNILAIPLAAGVLYPVFGWHFSPVIGCLAMSLSSVSVIANALRLKRMAEKQVYHG